MATTPAPYVNGDASQQLQARLNDPQTAAALHQILDKAELIAFAVTAVDGFLQRSEQIADEAARGVADLKSSTPPELTILVQHLPQLLELLPQLLVFVPQLVQLLNTPQFTRLLEVLSNPKTLDAIIVLMENIDKLAFAIEAVDGFLQRADTVIDNVAAGVKDATADLEESDVGKLIGALPQVAEATPKLLDATTQLLPILASEPMQNFISSGALDRLLNSGILASQTINVVGHAGDALVESYDKTQAQENRAGALAVLRASRDPDVQKALGFLIEFGKQFGREI
ncbi:MAG: DUF1641 domain-containing protein [Ardenticatenaceae bacterium]|nr:DUF1641 domain-containing protein [Ardenticatenaceae bacterium]